MPKKKAKDPEKENGERWLVTYSDLITLLLVFFIVLYASAESDTAKMQQTLAGIASAFSGSDVVVPGYSGSSIIDGYAGSDMMSNEAVEERNMDLVKQEIENISSIYNLGDSVEVTIDDTGVHIRIKDTVLFNSGEYEINTAALPIISKIGDVIKNLPTNYLQIDGHTDNVPINTGVIKSNWELGGLRAVNVAKILIRDCALNPKFISAVSYGEFRPIATNSTVEGRAYNRRVEITILRNYPIDKKAAN